MMEVTGLLSAGIARLRRLYWLNKRAKDKALETLDNKALKTLSKQYNTEYNAICQFVADWYDVPFGVIDILRANRDVITAFGTEVDRLLWLSEDKIDEIKGTFKDFFD